MSLSVVIPAWSGNDKLTDMLMALCQQVKFDCDELIVTEDGNRSLVVEAMATTYLHHQRLGHGRNLRLGWEAATKDYVAFIDSDIRIDNGNLRDLCVPNTLVYPTWRDWKEYRYSYAMTGKELWQWFVVAPRKFFEECPPYANGERANPNSNHVEGLDDWGDEIRNRFPTLHSDKVTYRTSGGASYGIL
jgi:glycosyltransferase involved in cell wall biosynthesis